MRFFFSEVRTISRVELFRSTRFVMRELLRNSDHFSAVKLEFTRADPRNHGEFFVIVGALFTDCSKGLVVQYDVRRYPLFFRQLTAMQP